MSIQPNIGLDATTRQTIVQLLTVILADETVLMQKTRLADADISGTGITDPHPIYKAQDEQIFNMRDEIIERIRILGGLLSADSEKRIDPSRLDAKFFGTPGMLSLLADHEAFIRFLREDVQKCSEIYDDQGTFALLVVILRVHEKMAWILRTGVTLRQSDHEK
jgi:starvation-inducible DNA-binding protein